MEAKVATKKYMVKSGAILTQAGVIIRPGKYAELTDEQYADPAIHTLLETPERATAIDAERTRVAREKVEAAAKADATAKADAAVKVETPAPGDTQAQRRAAMDAQRHAAVEARIRAEVEEKLKAEAAAATQK